MVKSRFAEVALAAAKISAEGVDPFAAWTASANRVFGDSVSQAKKGCPKGAFLGLAYAGKISGIAPKFDRLPGKNGDYALLALSILKSSPGEMPAPADLWRSVTARLGQNKQHNSQMQVVLALWTNKLLG